MEVEGEGVEEGGDECGTSERRRLSAIGAMADEPAQLWLDNLPRDDLQFWRLVSIERDTGTAIVSWKRLAKL